MGIGTWLARGASGLLVLAAAGATWDMATYDKAAWGADFERLKRDMAQGYANLDWAAEKRGLDLRRLAEETAEGIARAGSRLRAMRELSAFLAAFRDPHLRIEGRTGPAPAAGLASDTAAAAPLPEASAGCEAAGYEEDDHSFAFPFDRLPGWQALGDGSFPTGMAGNTGVIRIAQFGENRYLSACIPRFRPGMDQRALQLATRDALQGELKARIAALKRRGAERILVDLTGNGGGSEWVEEALALFAGRPLTRAGVWMAAPTCNRRAIWQGRKDCPGLVPPAEPKRITGTGDWAGRVIVLVDGNTASAAEDFAAWLSDNKVARLVGARTAGAGCGYVNGGTVTRFAAAPIQVKMPNCARFLADGTNEIEGLSPDVALPMERPEEAGAALAKLLAAR